VYQIYSQNSVQKCKWNAGGEDFMMTSISTDKSDNRVSIWHLKKPYLQ
jgi:uncharacterized protein with WD repeat